MFFYEYWYNQTPVFSYFSSFLTFFKENLYNHKPSVFCFSYFIFGGTIIILLVNDNIDHQNSQVFYRFDENLTKQASDSFNKWKRRYWCRECVRVERRIWGLVNQLKDQPMRLDRRWPDQWTIEDRCEAEKIIHGYVSDSIITVNELILELFLWLFHTSMEVIKEDNLFSMKLRVL